jgi:hypothetical protein
MYKHVNALLFAPVGRTPMDTEQIIEVADLGEAVNQAIDTWEVLSLVEEHVPEQGSAFLEMVELPPADETFALEVGYRAYRRSVEEWGNEGLVVRGAYKAVLRAARTTPNRTLVAAR